MDSLSLTEAKNKRTHIKAAATRLKTFIENFDPQHGSQYDLVERKNKLADLWEQFDTVQSRIEFHEDADATITDKEALLAQQAQQRLSFETPYFHLMTRYSLVIAQYEQQANQVIPNQQGQNSVIVIRQSRVRLPKIDLPVFNGAYDEWYSFQDTFEKLIHLNDALTDIERFHYLRSALRDKAAEIIKAIETTTENYNEAWVAVKERFDNKRWIIQRHIRAIFEAPSLVKEHHGQLRELLDTVLKHMRALKAIKRPTESWDDLVIHILVAKLDPITSKEWETSIPDKEVPDLKALIDFLSKRCQALEAISDKQTQLSNPVKSNNKPKGASVSNLATSNTTCPQCREAHPLYHCEAFLKLPIEKRIKLVKKSHFCINCLRSASHQAKDCNSSACRKCAKRHNTLLHLESSNESKSDAISDSKNADAQKATQPIVTQCTSTQRSLSILLSTAIIHVHSFSQEIHSGRALLDSGSQINFISERFANRLNLKERSVDISISGVAQGALQATNMVNVRFKSRFNKFSEDIECVVVPKITERLPQRFISKREVVIPKHIKLADPSFDVPSDIDMLIGAELFWRLICTGQIRTAKNQPTLQKTQLGWIISGPIPCSPSSSSKYATSCLAVKDDLNRILSRFWEVEQLLSSATASPEAQNCERIFQETTKRNAEGRFVVTLPIKTDKLKNLGESREIATRRLKTLERRLTRCPAQYEEYKHFMEEYLRLGHMREVIHPAETVGKSYYLPHHAVYNEASTTTRIQVVFDGSCRSTTGVSINDVLMIGPTIQEDLFSILVKFRTFKYGLTADITKMYRQVLVDPNDTALQRILRRNSIDKPISTFELLTVTYGTAAASFLAIRALRRLAKDNKTKFPIGAKATLNDFYVDDLVTGTDTLQEALEIKTETMQLLQEGRFELHKWASNEESLRDTSLSSSSKEFILASDKDSETRALGVKWKCSSDEFQFSSINCPKPLISPTKRSILSRIALIFDPLGLLGPSTVIAKIIMQDLWRVKMQWDESLPMETTTKWKQYERELACLRNIRVPRRVIALNELASVELHGFADASEVAYGACIYLRTTDSHGRHSTRLLCSKNRVASLKSLSIPRLELCAALLLAQLTDKIIKCVRHKINSVYLWTDSAIVLAWLQAFSRTWTPFVANRVGEIQELTSIQDWQHIRSEDNPADLLSRGIMPALLSASTVWWLGPPWLNQNREEWPQNPLNIDEKNIPERKSVVLSVTVTREEFQDIFQRYDKLTKLLRIVAYIFRFYNRVKQRVKGGDTQQTFEISQPIAPNEVEHAMKALIKSVQKVHFGREVDSLTSQQEISKTSSIIRLNPFMDGMGILRVGGRLKWSHLPYNAKHPALLPGRHPLATLIIKHEHERHLHSGPQATLWPYHTSGSR